MSGIFQFAVRAQAELEGKMTSVERVSYYCEVSSSNMKCEKFFYMKKKIFTEMK